MDKNEMYLKFMEFVVFASAIGIVAFVISNAFLNL